MDKKHMMQERSDWHRWVGSDWHRWWGRLALMNGQTAIRIAGERMQRSGSLGAWLPTRFIFSVGRCKWNA